MASKFTKSANTIVRIFICKNSKWFIKICYNWEGFDRKKDLFTGIVVFQLWFMWAVEIDIIFCVFTILTLIDDISIVCEL